MIDNKKGDEKGNIHQVLRAANKQVEEHVVECIKDLSCDAVSHFIVLQNVLAFGNGAFDTYNGLGPKEGDNEEDEKERKKRKKKEKQKRKRKKEKRKKKKRKK